MNASQLIEELKRLPGHLPVRVCLSEVVLDGDGILMLSSDCDAIEADVVIHEGNHILIESK